MREMPTGIQYIHKSANDTSAYPTIIGVVSAYATGYVNLIGNHASGSATIFTGFCVSKYDVNGIPFGDESSTLNSIVSAYTTYTADFIDSISSTLLFSLVMTNAGFGADSSTYAFNTNNDATALNYFNGVGGPYTNNLGINFTPIIPCFAEGTGILTTQGEVAVEDLTPDHVVVSVGRIADDFTFSHTSSTQPIQEVVSFEVRAPLNDNTRPICFKAGSMGRGMPSRDLFLSPEHCVATIWGTMKKARTFVGQPGISWDTRESVRYFHVILPEHHVVYANGLATESYRGFENELVEDGRRRVEPCITRFCPRTCATHAGRGPTWKD
jgi:hypothetical protein